MTPSLLTGGGAGRYRSSIIDRRGPAPSCGPSIIIPGERTISGLHRPNRPLTPATFHILLSLAAEPAHGYRIKRMVEDRTEGAVRLGAGTLYAGLQRMAGDGLIEETDAPEDVAVEPGARWRFYAITRQGRAALETEIARLESDLEAARGIVPRPA